MPHILWFDSTYMKCPEIRKSTETESRLVVARGWEGGENEEWLFNGYGVSFWGGENAWNSECQWGRKIVNVLDAAETVHSNMEDFCYVFFFFVIIKQNVGKTHYKTCVYSWVEFALMLKILLFQKFPCA